MLKNKARSAVFWSALDIFSRQGIGFVITVVLARLLVPEDFGTIALLALFLGIAEIFVNAGFSSALIQAQDATHVDESTVFWFNFIAGIMITALLFLLAPWIADFFALPILTPLTMLMACNVLISALGSIHSTLLIKKLDFKTPMKIGIASTLLSAAVAIVLAAYGLGVWALAAKAVVGTVTTTSLLWYFSPWRPALVFSRISFEKLFAFSGWLFASSLLDTVYQKGYTLLIGKFYGTYDLGIYHRADNTQRLPASVLSRLLSRVAFPIFSSVNKDPERLRRGVRMCVRAMMFIVAPSMLGLAAVAENFVHVVFGAQWLPAVPILQVLCVAGLLYPFHVINLNVLNAQGHSKLFFRLEIIKKTIGTALLVFGSFFGLMGIAWSRAAMSVVAFVINSHYTGKFLNYGGLGQIKDSIGSIALSALMAVVVIWADNWLHASTMPALLVLVIWGATFYLLTNYLCKTRVLKETIQFLQKPK